MAGVIAVFTTVSAIGSSLKLGQRALALWSRFPASAIPRPVVPVGEGVVLDPATGFKTGDAKIAFINGDFTLRTSLPKHPGRDDGYRLLTARAGFRLLRSSTGKGPTSSPPLAVTGVRLGTAIFQTDRGKAKLPAWLFSFRGVTDPAAVLAVAPPRVFYPPTPRSFSNSFSDYEEDSAAVSRTGTQLSISFVGAPAGNRPCDASYSATAVHSAHAVAFSITAKLVPTTGSCLAQGYERSVSLRLKSPLGGRALIDASNGGVIPVTRRASR